MSSSSSNITHEQQLIVDQIRKLLLESPQMQTKDLQKTHYKKLFELTNELIKRNPFNDYFKELKAVTYFSFVDTCKLSIDMSIQKLEDAVKLAPNIKFIKDRLASLYIESGRIADVNNKIQVTDTQVAVSLFRNAQEAMSKGDLQMAFHMGVAAHQKDPNNRDINLHLGILYERQGKISQANRHIDLAMKGTPVNWDAQLEKATLEQKSGESLKAVKRLELLCKSPEPSESLKKRANLLKLFYLNFLEQQSEDNGVMIYEEHLKFSKLFYKNIKPFNFSIKQFKSQKPIKIGYLSSHFNQHPITYFMEGILANHQQDQFEVHVFSLTSNPDEYTERLKKNIQNWHMIPKSLGLEPKLISEYIRSKEICILVSLDIHTECDGEIMAYRAAPIQVNYLGYPNTSGIDTVQYRITDHHADPYHSTQPFTETLIRMPSTFLTFKANHLESLKLLPPPIVKNGYITFGCYNTLSKIQNSTWECWKEILLRVPNSRLIVKAPLFIESSASDIYREKLKTSIGVPIERVSLIPYSMDTTNHYETYNEMDISLDTFPYNGTTTSMDSLWMGVPFITLSGKTHVHSVGKSILMNVGLNEFIAESIQQYIEIAVETSKKIEKINYNF
eukprot:gene10317-12661_t